MLVVRKSQRVLIETCRFGLRVVSTRALFKPFPSAFGDMLSAAPSMAVAAARNCDYVQCFKFTGTACKQMQRSKPEEYYKSVTDAALHTLDGVNYQP